MYMDSETIYMYSNPYIFYICIFSELVTHISTDKFIYIFCRELAAVNLRNGNSFSSIIIKSLYKFTINFYFTFLLVLIHFL